MGELKPCPFCRWQPPFEDADSMLDVLHKSGTWWADRPFYGKVYRTYRRHAEREEGDQPCWEMNCTFNMGGCGVRLVRDSREEAIAAWNTRPAPTEAEVEAAARRAAGASWLVYGPNLDRSWDMAPEAVREHFRRVARAALGVEP